MTTRLPVLILEHMPADGSPIGNRKLLERLIQAADFEVTEAAYQQARDALIAEGRLATGRGGSVRLVAGGEGEFALAPPQAEAPKVPAKPKAKTPAAAKKDQANQVLSYRHDDKRKNNPEVGMVNVADGGGEDQSRWAYDPHIDPALQFDGARVGIEALIDDALASGDADTMRAALEQLKSMQAPYLNWCGKAERMSFEVDTVALHVHERIDPATILAVLQKRLRDSKGKSAPAFQADLFSAAFENLPLRDAIAFYQHERDWANRLIAGDSLLVMNSLLQKESMAGQVQMIYIDPPYGIKYGSNFQPFTNKRDVKDRNDQDLTREPEMIKAFRDTWELGIHSYLTYLRDRLLLARELLRESGSVFVQISDENLHHVRELMDEIFEVENFVSVIVVQKTGGQTGQHLANIADYCVWYAKNKNSLQYRQLHYEKIFGEGHGSGKRYNLKDIDGRTYRWTALVSNRPPGSFPVKFQGKDWKPSGGYWKTGEEGFRRLINAGRVSGGLKTLQYKRFLDDFPAYQISNVWTDVAGSSDKVYVVQTANSVIQRCLLMTTDPGDLVLDPTCGSGTTAFVAEKWGRRWITCDTSRVAITLARQRLMTASYDYYELKYPHEGLKGGFIYKTVPHVTLKSIANNAEIDEIYERMHPAVAAALAELTPLPAGLKEWEVPFEWPAEWPDAARAPFEAFHAARQAMQKQMDDSIAAHADQETLYDQPEINRKKLRISGPFTVEAVPFPTVLGLEEAEQPAEADMALARSGETARQTQWRDELLKTGIRGKGGQLLKLADLEPLPGAKYIHAVGTVTDSGERAAVSFGPEHAALEQRQVEIAMREAGGLFPLPRLLVFCAFTFDPEAAKDIDTIKGIQALKAQMNTDLLTEDLKKGRANNESFWLMGQPDVEVRKTRDGRYQVEVHGFDYFDTKTGELKSGGKKNIAVWALDTDYDDRSLFPRQVFFPMAGAKDGWYKLRKDIKAELNDGLLEKFHGTVSLPFEGGERGRIAVKIVDDRGIESLRVIDLA